MRRYFFHWHDAELVMDREGHEHPDDAAAGEDAAGALLQIARNEIVTPGERRAISVHVTDEHGRGVYTATLSVAGTCLR